jgi:hypothetical protein
LKWVGEYRRDSGLLSMGREDGPTLARAREKLVRENGRSNFDSLVTGPLSERQFQICERIPEGASAGSDSEQLIAGVQQDGSTVNVSRDAEMADAVRQRIAWGLRQVGEQLATPIGLHNHRPSIGIYDCPWSSPPLHQAYEH